MCVWLLTVTTEWDEDYETKALETKAGLNKEPQRAATQLLRPAVATPADNKLPTHGALKAPEFLTRDSLPETHFRHPSSSANNGLAPRILESRVIKAPTRITKSFTDGKKSKQGWAELPGLITTRKGNQIALDAASNKYLGPIPENTDFNCTVIVIITSTRLKLTYPGVFRPL